MSRLKELIQELCPDGVEYVELKDIARIKRGDRITKKDITDDGSFIVMSGGVKPMGRYKSKNRNANTITISSYGAAGYVDYLKEDFWANDVCLSVFPNEYLIDKKFLYYSLKKQQQHIYDNTTKAIPDHIPTSFLEKLKVPLPSLEIQKEIVKILDKFTAYDTELQAELQGRLKQYEYYRDKSLTFSLNTPKVKLEKVIISLNTGLNPRKFFQLNTPDAKNFYVTIREIRNGKIIRTKKTDLINDKALKLCNNRSNLEKGDVLFSGTGTIGETAVISETPLNWNIKEGVYSIKPKTAILNPHYLKYLLDTKEMRNLYTSKIVGGTVKSLPMARLKELQIPLPPLVTQDQIVEVLCRFNEICFGLKTGIPAEIKKRQQQYEFYRNKLLTFKERRSNEQ